MFQFYIISWSRRFDDPVEDYSSKLFYKIITLAHSQCTCLIITILVLLFLLGIYSEMGGVKYLNSAQTIFIQ